MAIQLTITVKFLSSVETRYATDTFVLNNVKREDVDDNFLESFVNLCMGDISYIGGYKIADDEIYTSKDTQFPNDNEFTSCHHLLQGIVIDWKLLKSKTKVKTIK